MRLVRLQAVTEKLRESFWIVPALFLAAALAGGILLPHADVAADGALGRLVFAGDSDGARGVLGAIAGSVITVTSLTFSLTVVTLQLASSQFSPRLLRTFLRDLRNQAVLGVLLATFLYSLTVLRVVGPGGPSGADGVPDLAVTVAYLLVLASVLALVWFIQHIVDVIRVDTLMGDVRAETRSLIDRIYPADDTGLPDDITMDLPLNGRPVKARTSGFLLATDAESLCAWATERDLTVSVDCTPGTWVTQGTPWARIWGAEPDDAIVEALGARVAFGGERTQQQDVDFGIRQLIDVAAKALSPGVNDPTTAVHALGHVTDLLAHLTQRTLGTVLIRDDNGTVRAALARPSFADYLEEACGQVRRYGADEPDVVHSLLDLLADVGSQVTTVQRLDAVRLQLAALATDARREIESPHDAAAVGRHLEDVESLLDSVRVSPRAG